jgi:zinc protease
MRITRIILPLALLCAASPLLSQPVKENGPPEVFADSALRTGRLPNGLTYYIRRNEEPEGLAELRLVVRAGSVLEDADQRGGAHLLEHMAFNGTRRFRKDEIVSYLERLGMRFGADVNAFTGLDETVYRLTVPTDTAGALGAGLRVMEDWASSIALDPAELARERGVVMEERRSGRDAWQRIMEREHAFLWAGSAYADRLVIGEVEELRQLDSARLARFYRDWYRPDLMAVVVVGDFDADRVEELVRKGFGALPAPARPRARPESAVRPGTGPRYLVTTDPELTQTLVEVCWLRAAPGRLTRRDRLNALATDVFISLLRQRLEQAARQPGAAFEYAEVTRDSPVRPVRRLCIHAVAREGSATQALAAVTAEAERVARNGFMEGEWAQEGIERLQRTRRESTYYVTSQGAADAYVAAYLTGDIPVLPPQQAQFAWQSEDEVTREAAHAQARVWLRSPDRVVLVNAPGRAGAQTPAQARLAQVMDSVAAAELAPYEDLAAGGELMPRAPEPGRIVAEDTIADLGVFRWTLSNGARVVLRRWGGDDESVHLIAASPGGLSLVSDSVFVDAAMSPLVVTFSGLGGLSAPELERELVDDRVRVQPMVDDAAESVTAMSYPGSLETMFQLVHLQFTAPRLDTAAWNVAVRRITGVTRGRDATPSQVFTDTVRALLGATDPRGIGSSLTMVEGVDPARAVSAFRERFGNAADFTFYIAGRMEVEEARRLVERYLASLPSTGARETPADRGNRPPAGVVERTVRAGSEQSGDLAIVFSGEGRLSRDEWSDLQSVAEVLEHRLLARLRSDLGIIYDQDVTAMRTAAAAPAYYVAISVPAAPERLDEVVRVVMAEVDSLRTHGGSEDDVLRVREAARREWEENRFESSYWVDQLRDAEENGWDPRLISQAPPTTTLTRERVRDAARAYLHPDRYLRVTLVPADTPAPASRDRR